MHLRRIKGVVIHPAWTSWDKGVLYHIGISVNISFLFVMAGWWRALYIHEETGAASTDSWLLHHGVLSITDCTKFPFTVRCCIHIEQLRLDASHHLAFYF